MRSIPAGSNCPQPSLNIGAVVVEEIALNLRFALDTRPNEIVALVRDFMKLQG